MVAELISVGTELLLGNIVNTNARYLSRKCAEAGVYVYYQTTVGDNEQRLLEVVNTALSRSDVVILTGGLGPTKDDLTKEIVAEALQLELVEDAHTKKRIVQYFERIGKTDIPENNFKQAIVMKGSKVIDNAHGTAPGCIVEKNGKVVMLLPGPPNEMVPMFETSMFPFLSSLQPNLLHSNMVKIIGVGESKVETEIYDLIDSQSNPTIAPYAKTGEVHLRITASAPSINEAQDKIDPVVRELKNRFGNHIYSTREEETLEEVVVSLLSKHNFTVSTAESCTGGLLTGRLVNVSGVSGVLKEGYITYSNEAKSKLLKVRKETLDKYGAVSEQTAIEMVEGAAKAAGADAAMAITGIAGPDGGTDEKPVGTVCIACKVKNTMLVETFHFNGNREKVREYSVLNALDLLRRGILTLEEECQ